MASSDTVTIQLSDGLFELLPEVIERREPGLLAALRSGSQVMIREDQKRAIQELVGDELCETGLRIDDEPNAHGLELEQLIDAFSPYNLQVEGSDSSMNWTACTLNRSALVGSGCSTQSRPLGDGDVKRPCIDITG